MIYKNPKGSEFMDQVDYEDDKMYESRELETPYILDSGRNNQNLIMKNTLNIGSLTSTPLNINSIKGS